MDTSGLLVRAERTKSTPVAAAPCWHVRLDDRESVILGGAWLATPPLGPWGGPTAPHPTLRQAQGRPFGKLPSVSSGQDLRQAQDKQGRPDRGGLPRSSLRLRFQAGRSSTREPHLSACVLLLAQPAHPANVCVKTRGIHEDDSLAEAPKLDSSMAGKPTDMPGRVATTLCRLLGHQFALSGRAHDVHSRAPRPLFMRYSTYITVDSSNHTAPCQASAGTGPARGLFGMRSV